MLLIASDSVDDDDEVTTVPALMSYIVGLPTLLASAASMVLYFFYDSDDITLAEAFGPFAQRVAFGIMSAIVSSFVGNKSSFMVANDN